jgi:hypothetical protein
MNFDLIITRKAKRILIKDFTLSADCEIVLNSTLYEPNLRKLKDLGGLPPPIPWNPCCSDN